MSRDPWVGNNIRPQTLNGWSYVEGNPVNYVDPSGRWSEEMLDNMLGDNWQTIYFGDDCSRGIFAGRRNLNEFLISENTYDPFTLGIIAVMFNEARLLSQAGLTFDTDSPIDAMGFSLRISGGEVPWYAGFAPEGILNLTSGEFSIFGALGGGVLLGAKVGVTGGPYFVRNLPSNASYRNYFGSVGLSGGYGPGGTAEGFWGAPKTSPMSEGTYGGFVGGGPVAGLGVYGGYAFFIEAVRVDATGYYLAPDPLDYRPDDIIPIIRDDLIGTVSDYFAHLYGLN